MTTLKKFAMAVMLIAGFQQASADVCKLKVKSDILRVFEVNPDRCEVWVDVRDGRIYNLEFDNCVHIVKSSVVAFKDNGELKDEYKDAIFCNDERGKEGEVVINVDGANNIQEEAKRQFENIIKCGLIDKKTLNEQIYDRSIFAVDKVWQMPGISADISDLSLQNIPVMCAMKRCMHEYYSELDDDKK